MPVRTRDILKLQQAFEDLYTLMVSEEALTQEQWKEALYRASSQGLIHDPGRDLGLPLRTLAELVVASGQRMLHTGDTHVGRPLLADRAAAVCALAADTLRLRALDAWVAARPTG